MKRNRVPKRLFSILADTRNDEDLLRQYIREFALEELEANVRDVYEYIEERTRKYWQSQQSVLIERMLLPKEERARFVYTPPRIDSGEIMINFTMSDNYAATILKDLFDMKLLSRARVDRDDTRQYEYWIE